MTAPCSSRVSVVPPQKMTDEGLVSPVQKRIPIKSSVGDVAAQKRRQLANTVAKERRETLVRTKRLCRVGVNGEGDVPIAEGDMLIDEEQSVLEVQTISAVEGLKLALAIQGKGAMQERLAALRELRRLLSGVEFPPVEAALKSGAIPLLVQCLSFGSPDEQLLEAAWCLTNIAAGRPEETEALLPALPLLIAHMGEKGSLPVVEQCAWAIGNVAGEGQELRNILLSQGALPPLARMVLREKGSTVRTAAWSLSNLIKGPDSKAANELIKIEGVLDAILRHLRKADEELATEVAWVVVYLSALSNVATSMLIKRDLPSLLAERMEKSDNLQLHIPVLRSLGNLASSDVPISSVFAVGQKTTDDLIQFLVKCLKSEHRVLVKEAAWVLSNIATGSMEVKQLIYHSEAVPVLLHLLSTATFDIRKEAAYTVGNLCVITSKSSEQPDVIVDHLVSLVRGGCLPGFIQLVRSVDTEAARLGILFVELVLRGMPNREGQKLVEEEDGIEALERYQFHVNEELRCMANQLVDKYFGEDYGIEE